MSQVDWQQRYQTGDIPWDKGGPHPALPYFLSTHSQLFARGQRILLPGCGHGHDAAFIAQKDVHVTALDIAPDAIEKARARYPFPNVTWEAGDFLTLPKERSGSYDLVWEHTCFCAIPLERRDDYVSATARLLKPNGLLCGLFFLNPVLHLKEGPPFGVTRDELHERFSPFFEQVWDLPPPDTFEGREERETMMLWRRKSPS